MPRKLILLALGALVAAALVSARRRARPAQVDAGDPVETEGNGRDAGAQDNLRKFVEAGERLRGSSPTE